jgi:hypothetical protein
MGPVAPACAVRWLVSGAWATRSFPPAAPLPLPQLRRPRRRHGPVDRRRPRFSLQGRSPIPCRCLAHPLADQNARRKANQPPCPFDFPLSSLSPSSDTCPSWRLQSLNNRMVMEAGSAR